MFHNGSSQVSRRMPGNKAKLPAPGAYSILLFQPAQVRQKARRQMVRQALLPCALTVCSSEENGLPGNVLPALSLPSVVIK